MMIRITNLFLILCALPALLLAQEITIKNTLHRNYTLTEGKQNYFSEEIKFKTILTDFAFECIILDHVNTPVGFNLKNQNNLFFQYYNDSIQLANTKFALTNNIQKYWHHFIINFKGENATVFNNGEKIGEVAIKNFGTIQSLTIQGLLANEKYMQLNDLIKEYTFYDNILPNEKILENFKTFTNSLKNGTLPSTNSEIIVQPFLALPTKHSVNICWETYPVSSGKIKYGNVYPLQEQIQVTNEKPIQNIQIRKLETGTNYYAEVEIIVSGKVISTTKLSFKTAQDSSEAFRFAIIGDTEARPFVNAQIGKQIWGNRPDFFLLLGDVTDGGKKNYKDQWTMEFHAGTNALMQRVPIVPAAGNGDSDLYWFNQYFNPPANEGFYKYNWSNTDIFILNTYNKEELAPGKKQYRWLEKELQLSAATWKIVAFHYAPYSSDDNDYGNSWEGPSDLGDKKVRELVPLFDKYNIDFVIYGHLHSYERSWPLKNNIIDEENGTVYIVAGGAGGNIENFAPHRTWFSAKTFLGYHYLIANINNKTIRLDTYNSDGYLIDFHERRKE